MHDLDVFLTLESIKTNYKQIFKAGGYNASMTLRIYNLLSSGKLMKSIYLPQFLLVMHPLIYGNWIEKNFFAFRLYDGDNDGLITSVDVQDLIKNIIEQCPMTGHGRNQTKSCKCVLYNEVMLLYNYTLSKNLLIPTQNKKNRKHIDFMTFLFQTGLTLSCLVIEMQGFLL